MVDLLLCQISSFNGGWSTSTLEVGWNSNIVLNLLWMLMEGVFLALAGAPWCDSVTFIWAVSCLVILAIRSSDLLFPITWPWSQLSCALYLDSQPTIILSFSLHSNARILEFLGHLHGYDNSHEEYLKRGLSSKMGGHVVSPPNISALVLWQLPLMAWIFWKEFSNGNQKFSFMAFFFAVNLRQITPPKLTAKSVTFWSFLFEIPYKNNKRTKQKDLVFNLLGVSCKFES